MAKMIFQFLRRIIGTFREGSERSHISEINIVELADVQLTERAFDDASGRVCRVRRYVQTAGEIIGTSGRNIA